MVVDKNVEDYIELLDSFEKDMNALYKTMKSALNMAESVYDDTVSLERELLNIRKQAQSLGVENEFVEDKFDTLLELAIETHKLAEEGWYSLPEPGNATTMRLLAQEINEDIQYSVRG